tara:strand:+ start:218 stop:616 length:399 start_codon:yes stop_codon:yes gene_type:complete
MTPIKLTPHIIKSLRSRKDIWLDEAISNHKGAPAIRGVQLKRFQEREIRGAESYHPFEFKGWRFFGQAFAIETEFTRSKNPLSPDQLDWLDKFTKAGGQYIEARSMEDVYEALGKSEPQPWDQYVSRSIKIV